MSSAKITVKVTPGKSRGGTIVARSVVRMKKGTRTGGAPIYQTKAQLNVHLTDRNGKPRR